MWRVNSLEKTLMQGKIEERRRRGWQRTRWLDWHHWLNGPEFEQALGVGDGQGSLACCSPWGRKELDMTERLNNSSNEDLRIRWKVLCVVPGTKCAVNKWGGLMLITILWPAFPPSYLSWFQRFWLSLQDCLCPGPVSCFWTTVPASPLVVCSPSFSGCFGSHHLVCFLCSCDSGSQCSHLAQVRAPHPSGSSATCLLTLAKSFLVLYHTYASWWHVLVRLKCKDPVEGGDGCGSQWTENPGKTTTLFFFNSPIKNLDCQKCKAKIYSSKHWETELSLKRILLILDVDDSLIDFVLFEWICSFWNLGKPPCNRN